MPRHALIPARGGSTRVPRKNVRDFLGRPAIARVIDVLRRSGVVDDVIVSTDDAEIADVARAAGALVPFTRPSRLADDVVGARPVIQHAIQEMGWDGGTPVGVVYATAVLLSADDVVGAATLLDPSIQFVMSVAEYPAPLQRALTMDESGLVRPLEPSFLSARSQDLRRNFHDIGQMYWGNAAEWRTDVPVAAARTRAYLMDPWRAIDIDTQADWEHAERAFRMLELDD